MNYTSKKHLFHNLVTKEKYYRGRKYLFILSLVYIIHGIVQLFLTLFDCYFNFHDNFLEYIILSDFKKFHKKEN